MTSLHSKDRRMATKRSMSRRRLLKTGLTAPLLATTGYKTRHNAAASQLSGPKNELSSKLLHVTHSVDFCVVGGGLAGMCAAISAARHGAKVALVHDRPVLGGNASSEIRMHVCGAHGTDKRETGLVDEIMLENAYRNPTSCYSIWDSVLYEKVRFEPNIELFLNCSVNDIEMDGPHIRAVKAWQLTTETWHRIEAKLFADCSGDSILAPLSGAEFRLGRESRHEFNEDIEPETADEKTMGMSCLLQARETATPQPYVPPKWAHVYKTENDLPYRDHNIRITTTNFWWIELGGEDDSIHDTERIRDELLKVTFGVWDHIKNHGDHGAENWDLEWVGFLPGKRESRRYVGDHILTQNDVRAEGRFDDLVAYGGWTMDDHNPAGFRYPDSPNIFHPAPSPFGIPYRTMYSKNIDNLLFAGRNISTTHAAMSATRVMATCATIGQALGTSAAIAIRDSLTPREVCQRRIGELKLTLMDDDCWLPFNRREIPELTGLARVMSSAGDASLLTNGYDRPIDGADNGIHLPKGGRITFAFDNGHDIRTMRLALDSDLRERIHIMPSSLPLNRGHKKVPPFLAKAFHVEVERNGHWETVFKEENNYQRLVRIPLDIHASSVRLILDETWGDDSAHVFAADIR